MYLYGWQKRSFRLYTKSTRKGNYETEEDLLNVIRNMGLVYNDNEEDVVDALKTKIPILKEFKEKRITASQLSGDNILIGR